MENDLKDFLDLKYRQYARRDFIEFDPISIPHAFKKKQDIEIAGLFAAVLAWGQRKTIIQKCKNLLSLMDNSPYDFILNHQEDELRPLESFVHRTFNGTDLLYFVHFLKGYYDQHDSLEWAFSNGLGKGAPSVEQGLNHFERVFFDSHFAPQRTKKHIASPQKKSACKRLNMYLRWMVRTDAEGVDFGLWKEIHPSLLVCPCDLHVDRVARKLGLISRKQTDWLTALELTTELKKLDRDDPVKYDFALFGLGVEEKF